jgi:enoyl-CoA hydratase/carnithine racemase
MSAEDAHRCGLVDELADDQGALLAAPLAHGPRPCHDQGPGGQHFAAPRDEGEAAAKLLALMAALNRGFDPKPCRGGAC